MGPWPMPDDESAVPNELVPGAAALLPKAPPVADIWCDPNGNGPMKGPLLGTNAAIDREEAKVDKMIGSICRGC